MAFKEKISLLSTFLLAAAGSSYAGESRGEQTNFNDVYECTIVKYESEQSAEKTNAVEPFKVSRNGESDPVPAPAITTGEGDDLLSWRVTRYDGLISVEVADANGKVLSISTTADGNSIGLKVPSTKNILSCNPASYTVLDLHKNLQPNPMSYGTTINITEILNVNPTTYGSSRKLTVDPRAYGESIRIDPSYMQKNGKRYKRQEAESVEAYKMRVIADMRSEFKSYSKLSSFTELGGNVYLHLATKLLEKLQSTPAEEFVELFESDDLFKNLSEIVNSIEMEK